jgi:hypothetical protein
MADFSFDEMAGCDLSTEEDAYEVRPDLTFRAGTSGSGFTAEK